MNEDIQMNIVSSLKKYFPTDKVISSISCGTMLKDEKYSFQVMIKNNNLMVGCHLYIKGKNANYCKIRRVDCAPVNLAEYEYIDYAYNKNCSLIPDILRNDFNGTINLRNNLWSIFWVTVENLPVGKNIIEVVFENSDKQCISKKCTIDVIDEKLSKSCLIYSNWVHYDCISNYHKVSIFSKRYFNILGKYIDNAVNHGVNTIYIPLFTPPLDTKVDKERKTVQLIKVTKLDKGYIFDFTDLKTFIDFALEHGIKYFEFSHLFTQWGAKFAPKIIDINSNKLFGWETNSDSYEYLNFLDCFLKELNYFIKENNICDKCFYHISDEPDIKDIDRYKKLSCFVHSRLKNAKSIDALSNISFADSSVVDIPVVATSAIQPFLDKKCEIWAYYCSGQYQNNLSNRFLDFPLERVRVIGIQLYINNIKGFLHWGYNFYNSYLSEYSIDPYQILDADGTYPAGDCFIVYPTKNGVCDSIRHEVFYDGLQDYRALKKLEELKDREYVLNLLENYGYKKGFTDYPHDYKVFIKMRENINKCIKKYSI